MQAPTEIASVRQQRRPFWISFLGWSLLFSGLGGVLADSVLPLPAAGIWLSLGAVFLGAALFAVAAVLKAPPAPAFLGDLPDPWEKGG